GTATIRPFCASDRPKSAAIEFASASGISQTIQLTMKYTKAPSRAGQWPARRNSLKFIGSGLRKAGGGRSDAGHGARPGGAGAALHLLRGRQLDVHIVPLDPDRKDLDPVRLAAQALPRFEREGLLVHGAGDLGDALLIAKDAAREDRLALVRAGVLTGVPLAPGIEPEDGDLRIAVLDRAATVAGKVAHRPDANPSGS